MSGGFLRVYLNYAVYLTVYSTRSTRSYLGASGFLFFFCRRATGGCAGRKTGDCAESTDRIQEVTNLEREQDLLPW